MPTPSPWSLERWGRERAADVVALVAAALPGEDLTDDDVIANAFDDPDPTVVVGANDGSGFASGVVRTDARGRVTGHVQLVAVAAGARRAGLGRALVEHVQAWAFDEHGATAVVTGANAPFYLFAGVDVRATAALCLFEALGYQPYGANLNLSFPSSFRAPAPPGVRIGRVLDDADADRVVAFCEARWPNWVAELRRGIEHGACHAAFADDAVAGFGCHSVNRLGWLGPIATDPSRQRGGVGAALMSAIATDVMAAGFHTVEVSWIGPVRFYAKTAGASVSRVFRVLALSRPA